MFFLSLSVCLLAEFWERGWFLGWEWMGSGKMDYLEGRRLGCWRGWTNVRTEFFFWGFGDFGLKEEAATRLVG